MAAPQPRGAVSENPTTPPDAAPLPQQAVQPAPQIPTMAQAVQSATDLTPAMKAFASDAEKAAAVPTQEIYARKQAERAAMGIEAPGIEQRAKLMAERANAEDEAQRNKWLQTAAFFAKWGSTPGPVLVAGLNAVKETSPDIIASDKEARQVRMELDKSIAALDEATRLEKKGDLDAAGVEKQKAIDLAKTAHLEIIKIQEEEAKGVRADVRKEKSDIAAEKRQEGRDVRYAGLQEKLTQMKIDADAQLKKIEAGWRVADKSQAADNQLLKIWEVAQGAKGNAEAKIANIMKDQAYERARSDAEMDPSSSPAAAKLQAQGKTALDAYAETFKAMRDNADRTVSVIEENLRGRKIPLPASAGSDASKLTGDDKAAYEWANNPKSPNWSKEKADAIKKQLGVR